MNYHSFLPDRLGTNSLNSIHMQQQIISRPKNPTLPQVTLQSTVRSSVAPKYSHMDYQTYRTITEATHKRKTFTRNKFAEHNNIYVDRPQTTQPSRTNTHYHFLSQRRNFQQPSSNSVNFHDYPQILQDKSENYPFFQQNKKIYNKKERHQTPCYAPKYLSSDDDD